MSCKVRSYEKPTYESNYENAYKKRLELRKNVQKNKNKRLMFFAAFSFILGFILFSQFINFYDNFFIKRINNSAVKIPDDASFMRSSEQYFINNYFLGTRTLADFNSNDVLMKKPPLSASMPVLTNRLKNLSAQYSSLEPGIFIWDFSTHKYVDINADKEFPTASIVKIPVLLQLFRRIDANLIGLQDKMRITDYYLTEGSGFLQYKPVGTALSVSELAQFMIQESDNTATNMLLSTMGGVDGLDRALRNWGFNKTHLSSWLPDLDGTNVATPEDLGTMLYNIDNSNLLSLQNRAKIVEIMSHVKNRFLIQAGLPDYVQFIHKTGDIGTMLGDAGIVLLPDGRKYIIVIMVKRPWNSYSAKQFIIDASKTVYNSYAGNSQ